MALTGQLSDMSLAELIEFFCNQRKTGRLKVDYHRGHGVFFIKDGELVDAKVGALSGADAVYFALTLPNAAFDFSADFEPTRRTIKESWTQVVLEGLRRLDEGVSPSEADAFGGDWSPSESDLAMFMDHIERLGGVSESKDEGASKEAKDVAASKESSESAAPMSMMVESASSNGGGGKKKMLMVGAAACVVLICAVAAIPVARKFGGSQTSAATVSAAPSADAVNNTDATTANEAATTPAPDEATTAPEEQTADAAPATVDPAAAALAARREREQREREARERARRLEEAKKNESSEKTAATDTAAASAKPAVAASGPKMVRVSVSYDEAGRVTQASVAGVSPGAEAYGGTAVRIARGRRFPAGKAGGTVITIPVN